MKYCKENDCNTRPNYNLPDKKIGIYCLKHKKDNMVNVVTKKCLEENCKTQPNYNLPDKKLVFIVQNIKKIIWLILNIKNV
jgi:hypothetical protein